MEQILCTKNLGDIQVQYVRVAQQSPVELRLLPLETEVSAWRLPRKFVDSMVQVHLTGGQLPGGYSPGISMRQGATVEALELLEQTCCEKADGSVEICTVLAHPWGCHFTHHLYWDGASPCLDIWVEAEQVGEGSVTIEHLSSFSIGGICSYLEENRPNRLRLHRLKTAWSMEGRYRTDWLDDLNLERSWACHGVRCERFGQVGSMATNGWFPWMLLEDPENEIFWGCQLAHNASWQMEVSCQDDLYTLSGGLADYEFGHWRKTLAKGERLVTPKASVTVCHQTDKDLVAKRLVL